MPIYAYRCESCGHEQDVLQKVSDAPLTVCPSCGQPSLRKQLTAAGFQLKGSGWYVTDFRDKGGVKPPAGKDGEAGTADAAAADAKGGQAGGDGAKAADPGSGGSAATPAPATAPAPAAAPPAGAASSGPATPGAKPA